MLSREEFIRMSLELDLFFLRTMKEHALFIKASFTAKNLGLAEKAGYFLRQFDGLLQETVQLCDGVLPPGALSSGQFFTQFTPDAEKTTQYYTGILVNSSITIREMNLQPAAARGGLAGLEGSVSELNQRSMAAVTALISFKHNLLTDVLACRLYTASYPLVLEHVMREAAFFQAMLVKLQARAEIHIEKETLEQETFWNHIMAEHARFIRGLLDPTEEDLFESANLFGRQFDELTQQARLAQGNPALAPQATVASLAAAVRLRDFKAAGTGGILGCRIRSVMLPLLADHVLREANHYIYMLSGI